MNGNTTNLYMISRCMKILLDEEKYSEFNKSIKAQINKLKGKLKSIDIKDILKIMGYKV